MRESLKTRAIYLGISTAVVIALLGCEAGKNNKPVTNGSISTPITAISPTPETPGVGKLPQIEFVPPLSLIGEQVKRVAVGDNLRNLEEQFGKRKLTFQDATRIVSLTTRLYEESTGSSIISGNINKQVFIVEGTEDQSRNKNEEITRSELEQIPFIRKLISNYPASSFSDSQLKHIAKDAGRATGFVDENLIFMNLDTANEDSVTIPTYPYYPKDQFLNIGLEVNCSPLGPATSFRATLLHELFHKDTAEQRFPVDPAFIPIFQVMKGWLYPVEPQEQYGFGIIGKMNVGDIVFEPLFEEKGADYMAARIAVVNGLGYGSSDYSNPSALYNLGQMLAQAGIDDITMLDLHRRGQLKEFMTRIGQAAKGKIDDPLSLSFALARGRITDDLGENALYNDRPWKARQEYFPTVTGSKYKCK